MSITQTIFQQAGEKADRAYKAALKKGMSESEARDECKAEFYCGLFAFFMNTNLSKWNANKGT